MGLLQRAIETYDANTALIGVYRDGHEPLAPIGHILTSANIEITLNAQGKFLAARKVDKKEPKILIPVTEESSGRTSGLAAHPLCEMCLKEGRLTPVDEVHHIVPISQGGTHARDNLMSLCRSCHTKIHHDLGDR